MTDIEKNIQKVSRYATKHKLDLPNFVKRVQARILYNQQHYYTYHFDSVLYDIRLEIEKERQQENERIALAALAEAAQR